MNEQTENEHIDNLIVSVLKTHPSDAELLLDIHHHIFAASNDEYMWYIKTLLGYKGPPEMNHRLVIIYDVYKAYKYIMIRKMDPFYSRIKEMSNIEIHSKQLGTELVNTIHNYDIVLKAHVKALLDEVHELCKTRIAELNAAHNLPKRIISPKIDQCSICQISVSDCYTLCNHQFCYICLNTWYHEHTTCPMCRQPITDCVMFPQQHQHDSSTAKAKACGLTRSKSLP